MKRLLLTPSVICALALNASSQTVQFTLRAIDATTMEVYFKPTSNIGPVISSISDATLVLQLPTSYPTPQGNWGITSNTTYFGTAETSTETSTTGTPMHNTFFSWSLGNPSAAGVTFNAGTEYLVAVITTPVGVATRDVVMTDWGNNRIDNGTSGLRQGATSMSIDGTDRTDNVNIFYANASTEAPMNSGDETMQSTLSIGVPLAIGTINFSGKVAGSDAQLTWNVENEKGILSYDIEYGYDSKSWTKAGAQSARNDASAKATYQFVHAGALATQDVYYRLKAIGGNNTISYSNIIKLTPSGATLDGKISVFPTVARAGEVVKVKLPNNTQGVGQIMVVDALGQVVEKVSVQGNSELSINTAKLASGTYYIKVNASSKENTTRFIIL